MFSAHVFEVSSGRRIFLSGVSIINMSIEFQSVSAHYAHSIALNARFSGMQDELTTTHDNPNVARLTKLVERHENHASVFFIARLPRLGLNLTLESSSNVIIVVIVEVNSENVAIVAHNQSPAVYSGLVLTSDAIWLANPVANKIRFRHTLSNPLHSSIR